MSTYHLCKREPCVCQEMGPSLPSLTAMRVMLSLLEMGANPFSRLDSSGVGPMRINSVINVRPTKTYTDIFRGGGCE